MKVIVRTIGSKTSRTSVIGEADVAGDWADAAVEIYNAALGYAEPERRFILVSNYAGREADYPYGAYTVQFGRRDRSTDRYVPDPPVTVDVRPQGR